MKTRPTQNAIHQLASYGVTTDIIIGRSSIPLDNKRKEKIALACNILPKRVISAPDIESIYDVPANFDHDHIGEIVLEALNLEPKKDTNNLLLNWKKVAKGLKNGKTKIRIAVVGKYFNTGDFILTDAYLSVIESIKYSAYANNARVEVHSLNARDFEVRNPDYSIIDGFDGVIVPGGFGESGIEGKLNVIRYVREKKIPYFGLCYGMQLMTVEYARNVLGLKGAHTTEIDPKSPHPVIDIMPDQKKKLQDGNYGGSMRLGLYPAIIRKDTLAHRCYSEAGRMGKIGPAKIKERHRHRYEVNPKFVSRIEKGGLVFSGKSPDGVLMEIAELPTDVHPFFLGTQFHPEFLARPLAPHPLFTAFISASKARNKTQMKSRSVENASQSSAFTEREPISIEKELFTE